MNSIFSGLIYICILFVTISIGGVYGSLVDEGLIIQFVPTIFWSVILLNIGYPSWCIYTKYNLGLFIYGIILVIIGGVAKYYDYFLFLERGFGIYGNFISIVLSISGIIICAVSYIRLKK